VIGEGDAPARVQLRVLALIDHLALGGAEMLLSQFAVAAPLAGIALQVAYFEPLDGNPAADALRAVGVEPTHLDIPGRPSRRHVQVVRRHIEAVGPAVVHTHLGAADLIGGIAARRLGVPAVSTLHEIVQRREGMQRAKSAVFTLGRRLCDARVIAVSESAREAYMPFSWGMGDRVVKILNGIDVAVEPGSGAAVRRELGIAPEEMVVAMISALRTEKAHEVAIEAVARLRERFPRLRLLIVGSGPLADELALQAAPHGDAVLLTGRRNDVMSVLDASDVCLHPSRREAFPTTLIEALAASVPVLATRVGGIPEIVEDGRTGVLVAAPPTVDDVAGALGALLADRPRREALARAGRETYLDRFTARPWVERTRALYDTVIAESTAPRWRRRLAQR
jgi:glycosyltransferase involved in cell wall biosynthesis